MTGPTPGPPAGDDQPRRQLPPELDPRRGSRPDRQPATPTRPRRSRKRIAAWIAGGLAALLVVSAATGWAALDYFIGKIKHISVFCHNCDRPDGGVTGDLNILVVGSDSRAGLSAQEKRALHVGSDPGQRSDTMILVHLPRGGGRAVLVNLPRDSYVTIPSHVSNGRTVPASKNKINAAYSLGGAPLTVRTVEANTGVRIDHYIEINFAGFVNMVNALGGVTVCNSQAINDPVVPDPSNPGHKKGSGLRLPAGRSKIQGAQALAYVRAREFDPTADLGRIKRQQKFMAAMVQKAESTGVLLNPVKLVRFLNAVTGSLETDPGFGAAQIRRLALKLRNTSPSNIQLMTVPLADNPANIPAGDVQWDPVLSKQVFADLTQDRPIGSAPKGTATVTIPPSSISVKVLNAAGTPGLASTTAAKLRADGFLVGSTGNAPAGSAKNQTVVRYGARRADSARTVAAAVPGAKLVEDASLGNSIALLVGSDFTGVRKVVVASSSPGTSRTPQVRTAADDACS